jgi:hypothetical protein
MIEWVATLVPVNGFKFGDPLKLFCIVSHLGTVGCHGNGGNENIVRSYRRSFFFKLCTNGCSRFCLPITKREDVYDIGNAFQLRSSFNWRFRLGNPYLKFKKDYGRNRNVFRRY